RAVDLPPHAPADFTRPARSTFDRAAALAGRRSNRSIEGSSAVGDSERQREEGGGAGYRREHPPQGRTGPGRRRRVCPSAAGGGDARRRIQSVAACITSARESNG